MNYETGKKTKCNYCKALCNSTKVTAYVKCQEKFNWMQCIRQCEQEYDCDNTNSYMLLKKPYVIRDSVHDFLKNYQKTIAS